MFFSYDWISCIVYSVRNLYFVCKIHHGFSTILVYSYYLCRSIFNDVWSNHQTNKAWLYKNLYNNHLLSGMALVIYIVLCYALYYFNHCFVNINEYEANQLLWYVVEILGIYSCTWIAHLLKSNSFVSFAGKIQ